MAEREPGPYWVKPKDGDWEVGSWTGASWALHRDDYLYEDAEFAEIGERANRRYSTPEQMAEAWRKITGMQQWPDPQPITDHQKTGKRFLVWYEPPPEHIHSMRGWIVARWDGEDWVAGLTDSDDIVWLDDNFIVHYLPLPPDVKP